MKRLTPLLTGALLFTGAFPLFAQGSATQKSRFRNEPGWVWQHSPSPADWALMSADGLVMRLDELKSGELLLTLASTIESAQDVVGFRPVAFNAAGERFEFAFHSGGSGAGVTMQGYVLDSKTLPLDEIQAVGVEKLTVANLRDVIAPASFQNLKKAGVNALPFPRIGEPYEFELTTIDGQKVSSAKLRGKVVLLDFWAKWCGPCMAKMPALREAYQRLKGAGFEIVGLNHDDSVETAKRVIDDQKLAWANVLAPVDDDQRGLWMEASGTTALPRLLLIDRDGVLRADVNPDQLVAEVEKLLARPSSANQTRE